LASLREEVLNHDYEEPFFKPASEEEGILAQLKKMSIPMVDENKEFQCVLACHTTFSLVYIV
jgi:hypothetical protein